ncbi:LysR substrate-binding domain-containing protein [Pseudomonas sp. CCI3.2]|uniref:LysR substrate-binding domain-containing protein n=1 Tax=unclassified Pseudomonas TaxID=196821 RepID=UPI002AC8BFBB|nr:MULTISPECIES: LysR substrate-binding domain-containing protein [unclassified Pseudomonas]MEB0079394.1 LysR substrate-binding domain-containing protein [Pseudomonas sp. MH10out]MEB0103748.1 LysR substrate-binding domain-containing protein [Pseudomonas sp. CCI3.2]MEB0132407.1 LysR substrate-binding domain-containing protein [Pseudomonas sp. CCI2.4]MEB0159689.1 LysR substrate-binding domain-containing protein [Pseudomonas sp. AH2 (2023)]MEB0169103.1 LysR substrate-binding domain-containing pro
MDLRHLRYFLAVAEEGHFGRAAQRLHIVQSALSMQIRGLEEELGGALFLRTSRRVELTEAGVLLRAEAQRTLDQAAHAQRVVQRSLRGEIGSVRIGFAGNAVFSGRLMADVRAFSKAYPDAEIILRELAPQQQVEAIQNGQLDLGYAPSHGGQALNNALLFERIGTWPLVVALPEDHPLANQPTLRVPMLRAESLIIYADHGADEYMLAGLRNALGREPKVQRTTSTLSVLALVAAGMGVAMVPAPLMQVNIPGLVYRTFEDIEPHTDLLLISRVNEIGGAVRAFLKVAHQGGKLTATQ